MVRTINRSRATECFKSARNVSLKNLLACLVFVALSLSGCGSPSGNANNTKLPIFVSVTQSGTSNIVFAGTSAVRLSASVANDLLNAGVTWSLSPATGCGTLTASGSTAIYSPPAVLTANCSAAVTATSVADNSSQATIVFSVSESVAIKVSVTQSGSSSTIAAGSPPITLTASLQGDSTNAGVRWSLSPASGCGTLVSSGLTATYTPPSESSLNANCMATPTAASVAETSSSASLAFTVNPVAIALSAGESTTPTAAAQGSSLTLSASLVNDASGSATLNWITGGSSCGTLANSTGLSATFVPPSSGSCTATVTASTSINPNITQVFNIKVNPSLAITTASLTGGSSGVSYSAALAANGGIPPYSWHATNLPAGLTLSSSGVLSGTPTVAAGSYSPTFAVTDSDAQPRTVQQSLSIAIGLTLSGITPNSGQAGITSIALTCNGFPSGTPASAANVQITLTPVGGGSPLNITPTSATNVSGAVQLTFQLPGAAGTGPVSPTLYNVSLSDTTDGGLSSGNTLPFTENPAASLTPLSPNSGFQGATNEMITISGNFTNFLQGTTQANFGAGITVNNVTVSSPTSATADITIASSAATGTRSITLSTGSQSETQSFTVNAVSSTTFTVSGQVKLVNGSALVGATLNLGSGLTGTTDSSGNYSIASVPTGSYTLTPSFTMPAGDSAVFYPATENITVSTADLSGQNFGAQLGFTVSGSVSYSGSKTKAGQAYIKLQLPNCACCPTQGTSVPFTSRGATTVTVPFSIHGVPPGTYTGQAFYDLLGVDMQNIADPTANSVAVTVSNADVTGISFPMTDPTATGNVSPASPDTPLVMTVSPIANGVAIYYPSVKVGGVEQALGYNVNWSYNSPTDCQSPKPSFGGGLNVSSNSTLLEDTGNVVFLDGGNSANAFVRLSPVGHKPAVGQQWFFCLQGVDGHGNGGTWYNVAGGSTNYATVTLAAAPTSSGAGTSTVTMNVTIPATTPFTGNPISLTGPLYTGCYNPSSLSFNVHSEQNASLTVSQPGSTTSYSVFGVPNGTNNCSPFAWVDNDNDGVPLANQPFAATTAYPLASSGDLFNFGRNIVPVSISGATSESVDLTGFSENSVASLITQSFASFTDQNSVVQPQSYAVNFSVQPLLAQPGTVQLQSPSNNLNSLMDFAVINHGMFNMSLSTSTVQPLTTDSYSLLATPLNTTLPADNWGGSTTCLAAACPLQVSGVNTSFATALSASGNGTPTFSWGDGAGLVTQFTISDTNGNVIWQVVNIPSTTTSLTWPTDPTGAGHNAPTSTLASGTYIWSITTVDSNGNLATQKQVFLEP